VQRGRIINAESPCFLLGVECSLLGEGADLDDDKGVDDNLDEGLSEVGGGALKRGYEEVVDVQPEMRLVEKHSRAIRWMHWINFPVLTIMIWSGLLIYWGASIPPYSHAHQVYRIGIGSWTLVRLFPDWFWKMLDAPYQLTTGMGYHFLFMWVFAINGIAYVVYLAVSGEWRVLWPKRRSFVEAMWVTLYDMHWPAARRRGLPAQGKYNGAQRIAYTAIVLMGAGSLLTGLAIYKPTQAHWLTTLLGGYEMARWLHFWLTMGFCGFFLVHVGQVVLAGWNNFRSMVSGAEVQVEGRRK
jgi:thiosulfate reductase cytochrome b subunit